MTPRFVLQPARFREDKIVDTDDPPLVIESVRVLVEKFAPAKKHQLVQLRSFRSEAFVGWARGLKHGVSAPFLIWNPDRSNKVGWVLKTDPTFPSRVTECYRVVSMNWGTSIVEAESGKKDAPLWQSSAKPGRVMKESRSGQRPAGPQHKAARAR